MSLKAIATAAELPLSHVTALTSLGKGRKQRQDAEKFNEHMMYTSFTSKNNKIYIMAVQVTRNKFNRENELMWKK